MTDNARGKRKREVAKERCVEKGDGKDGGGREGRLVGKGEAGEHSGVPVHEQLALFALSLARQQHHHKTSLSSGNFSGIVTVNNVHLTFSFSLPHIVNPSHISLSIIKLIVDGPVHVVAPLCRVVVVDAP